MTIMNRACGKSAGVWTLASSRLTRKHRTRLTNTTEHTWELPSGSRTVFMATQPPGKTAGRLRTATRSLLGVVRRKSASGPQQGLPADLGDRPVGCIVLAHPPASGMLYVPGRAPGGQASFHRVHVRPCPVEVDTDLWEETDGWITGEYETVLGLQHPDGTTFCTRSVVDWVMELMVTNPAAWARLQLAMAEAAQDQASPANLN